MRVIVMVMVMATNTRRLSERDWRAVGEVEVVLTVAPVPVRIIQ